MKKTLLLAAALACSGAVAQEKEVWACQMEEGTLLNLENSKWGIYQLTSFNVLFTLNADGVTAIAKRSDGERLQELNCSTSASSDVSCLDLTLSLHYFFTPDAGKLARSSLYGIKRNGDSVTTAVFDCTKF